MNERKKISKCQRSEESEVSRSQNKCVRQALHCSLHTTARASRSEPYTHHEAVR